MQCFWNQKAGLMDDELKTFGAQQRIPAQMEIAGFEVPEGSGPEHQPDPVVAPADDLVERAALGLACAQRVFGVEQIVEALAGEFLGDDTGGEWRR